MAPTTRRAAVHTSRFSFFSSKRRQTRFSRDWSSDVCSSDLKLATPEDIRRTLAGQIAAGELRPGQRLGAERARAAELGVSRALLRQALSILEDGGMIRRVPGRGGGTYVSRGKIERDMSSRIEGIPALLRSQGVTAGTHVLSARLAEPDDDAAQARRVGPGELAVDLLRLRLPDGSPPFLEHARFPATPL